MTQSSSTSDGRERRGALQRARARHRRPCTVNPSARSPSSSAMRSAVVVLDHEHRGARGAAARARVRRRTGRGLRARRPARRRRAGRTASRRAALSSATAAGPRHRRAVRAVARHGVEARRRQGRSGSPAGSPRRPGRRGSRGRPTTRARRAPLPRGARRGDRAHDALADRGVLAHQRPLVLGQRAGLEQHVVGDAELADVVQERDVLDVGDLVGRQAEAARRPRSRARRPSRCARTCTRHARRSPRGAPGPPSRGRWGARRVCPG